MNVGVIAGSPVDTQMGIDVLTAKGIFASAYPVVQTAREGTEYQMQPLDARTERIRVIMKQAMADGMDAIMVYCNSLSSTIDMEGLGKELGIPVVTPLMAYAQYAGQYQTLAVMAGNNQGLAGIERTIMTANLSATVIGISLLPMVVEVEARTPPEKIVEKFALMQAFDFFRHTGAEAFIFGCTHFPYVRPALEGKVDIPMLDPSDAMCEMLLSHSN